MRNALISGLLYLILCATNLHADGGWSDVAHIRVGEQSYFVEYYAPGVVGSDYNYYDYNNTFLQEGKDVILSAINSGNAEVHTEMHFIDASHFPAIWHPWPDTFLILKEPVRPGRIDSIQIVKIYSDYGCGYTYSKQLKQSDNAWLTEYPIEKYFEMEDEMCHLVFYGIKGDFSRKEKEKIHMKLTQLLLVRDRKGFEQQLDRLYRRSVIMIGACSCC